MYHIFEGDRESAAKQRKLEESDRQVDNESEKKTVSLGAANLSLKHLLAAIDNKRDELSLTDLELRNLISDVRKNRSKWYNEQRIGQEELYEACEKVVMELRGYTEHSTAFLTKVNKRDAPNYFNIIKKPMDLNTVMKKLKTLSYTNKKEFVDDLNLIWDNCLAYNTDPKHFLRAHAFAMRKKMQTLTPLIPDITVRDRAEVEAEEREANGIEEPDDSQLTRTSRKAGGGKQPGKKGRKRKIEEAQDDEEQGDPDQEPKPKQEQQEGEEDLNSNQNQNQNQNSNQVSNQNQISIQPQGDDNTNTQQDTDQQDREQSARPNTTQSGTPAGANNTNIEDEDFDDELDNDDVQSEVWHNVYSKQRAKYSCSRGDLFKNNRLQTDAPASIRRFVKMNKFDEALKNKAEEAAAPRGAFSRGLLESLELEKEPFILEYEVAAGLPEIPWHLDPENEDDGMANVDPADIKPSSYITASGDHAGGLTPIYDSNLRQMQEIRKVCSKIALIRQMQQQTYMHSASIKPYKVEEINEKDLDLESRLPNRDEYDGAASGAALKRSVSKISMHTGFEVTEMMAIDALTEITADYMTKLGRTLMMLVNDNNNNECGYTSDEILTMALQQNGIQDVNSLDSHVSDIQKQGPKLEELLKRLESFLADLLRPATELDDDAFQDNSETFLNGEFSEEIGEDFFGFKELGLDKELGLLTSSVPLHLLHARFNASLNSTSTLQDNRIRELTVEEYRPMDRAMANAQIGLLRKFYLSKLDAATQQPYLLEGEQLPPKQRNTRPKLPPTGKIANVKKKPLAKVFFRPPSSSSTPPPPPPPVHAKPSVAGKTVPGKTVAGKKVPGAGGKTVPGSGKTVSGKKPPPSSADNSLIDDDLQLELDESIESLF